MTDTEGLSENRQEIMRNLTEENVAPTIDELHKTYEKWLELSGDIEFLDVIYAARLDRRLPGDPVWLFTISNSGGTKTEIVRSLNGEDAYTLDSITAHTFVSGKVAANEDGQIENVRGILPQLDGKVLIIKDFTVILSKREEERSEIFAQLRAIHDGYLEFAYGTTNEPIRIKADIGLIAACTPAIDMYGKLSTLLGERFLKVRHLTEPRKTAMKAAKNLSHEGKMRSEIETVADRFIRTLQVKDVPVTQKQIDTIIELACATATLRTPVMIKFWRYEENEGMSPNIEYPTRLTKQYLKLAKLLANVRGHTEVTPIDMLTIQRVARDTCVPSRIKIIRYMLGEKRQKTTRQISEGAELPLMTCWRDLKELEYLGAVYYEQAEESSGTYGPLKHKPEKDGWTLREPHNWGILYENLADLLAVPQTTYRENIENTEKENPVYPLVVSGTAKNKLLARGAADVLNGKSARET